MVIGLSSLPLGEVLEVRGGSIPRGTKGVLLCSAPMLSALEDRELGVVKVVSTKKNPPT